MDRRLLFVLNDPAFFVSHRLPLAVAARKAGFEVHVATMAGAAVADIVKGGFTHHVLPLSRSGKNPCREVLSFFSIYKLFRRVRPDIVHLVTIKPVLYGGIAARLAGVSGVVSAVSGLGFVFIAQGLKAAIVRFLIKGLYRLSFGKANLKVIFQNPDDRDALLALGALDSSKVEMIRGSGVDLREYPCVAEPEGQPVVCMAARLLKDKGVFEFVEAVRLLRQRGVDADFWLIGDPDPGNPASVSQDDLQGWREEGVVKVLGYRKDIAALFSAAHIVVLPSYREGLPKVLVEAAACGRAVITTDVPGCRDAIDADVSGLLVPVQDSLRLADSIQRLIEDLPLRQSMGAAGRDLAEREFTIEQVARAHLDIYQQLELGVGSVSHAVT